VDWCGDGLFYWNRVDGTAVLKIVEIDIYREFLFVPIY
jgi:hypothetical protein